MTGDQIGWAVFYGIVIILFLAIIFDTIKQKLKQKRIDDAINGY